MGLGGPAPSGLGLGGGLCWAALDRYLRGSIIPRNTAAPEPGDPLGVELRQRQVAALAGAWPKVRDWQSRADGSWRDRLPIPIPFPGGDLASLTRAEAWGLRRQLESGHPVLLTLLLDGDGYNRPRAVRQVLATGWSREGPHVTLSIYDPDRPADDDVQLAFRLAGPLDARLTGGRTIRGFFPVAYDRAPVPALRCEAFDDRSVIGLNRKVRGRADAAAGRGHVTLVARNEQGALLHFQRARGGHWEGVNVTETEGLGAQELHSDPVAIHRAGTLHVFARSYVGDLLHLRQGRSWSLTNRTEQKRAGARFRLAGRPIPVPGPWLQLSVLGRDSNGGLVHYMAAPFRGWRAEQVPGDPVAEDPMAARQDGTLHVVGVSADGRILHSARKEFWTLTDTDAGPGPEIRLAGSPLLLVGEDGVHVFGRTVDDELAVLRLGDAGVWERDTVAGGLAGDPAATRGPAGLHVFAPTADGGLVHAWGSSDDWSWEDVVASRPTMEPDPAAEADVSCWGDGARLRVFVRRGRRLAALTWTRDADWVADPLTERADDRPLFFRDHEDNPHLVLTDARGTVLHVETGDWREPEREPAVPVAPRAASPEQQEQAAPAMEATADDAVEEPDTAARDDEVVILDFEVERRMPAQASPGATADQTPAPAPEEDAAVAEAEPPTAADAPAEKGAAEKAPKRKVDPSIAPTLAALDAWEPELARDKPDAGDDTGSDTSNATPAETEKREYRWEDRPPPIAPHEVEPMDLSLLDSWPKSLRRPRGRDVGRSRENDDSSAGREAS